MRKKLYAPFVGAHHFNSKRLRNTWIADHGMGDIFEFYPQYDFWKMWKKVNTPAEYFTYKFYLGKIQKDPLCRDQVTWVQVWFKSSPGLRYKRIRKKRPIFEISLLSLNIESFEFICIPNFASCIRSQIYPGLLSFTMQTHFTHH